MFGEIAMPRKVYVDVIARFRPDGRIIPLSLTWEDGLQYAIDRVLDVRPAASLKAGGSGLRYTCIIMGRQRYLWLEGDRWFVEALR